MATGVNGDLNQVGEVIFLGIYLNVLTVRCFLIDCCVLKVTNYINALRQILIPIAKDF